MNKEPYIIFRKEGQEDKVFYDATTAALAMDVSRSTIVNRLKPGGPTDIDGWQAIDPKNEPGTRHEPEQCGLPLPGPVLKTETKKEKVIMPDNEASKAQEVDSPWKVLDTATDKKTMTEACNVNGFGKRGVLLRLTDGKGVVIGHEFIEGWSVGIKDGAGTVLM